jgi:UDP-2,4-diacetamido-2,4,6-trideoxy-beta-L-altropyranose hydrolase
VAKIYIAFRVDASNQIGTGHFMRCLTLADELQKQGAQIRFISRNLPTHLSVMLTAKGMEYLPLSIDEASQAGDDLAHASWLGTSQSQDAQATVIALANHLWDWIVVDHYALDKRWESAVRGSCKKLMVIDDIADRQHDCDVLLDQNYYADMKTRYISKVPTHCQLFLGPRYALLREEFRTLRNKVKVRTGDVKKILVFFGGVDADNYTSLAIQALAELNSKQQVDVVIGSQHPKQEQIQQACMAHGYACYVQTSRMAELMAEADLAIGGGGTATWERCCLGLPAIVCAIAHNQIKAVTDLSELGAIISIDITEEVNSEKLKVEIRKVLEGNNVKKLSSVAYNLVDANGVNTILEVLERNYGR